MMTLHKPVDFGDMTVWQPFKKVEGPYIKLFRWTTCDDEVCTNCGAPIFRGDSLWIKDDPYIGDGFCSLGCVKAYCKI
jgi:hypothetical protein